MNAKPRPESALRPARAMPAETGWGVMYEQARILVNSGFLPKSVNTPEKALAIMMTGEELGIPKMLALRSIHVIEGTPTLSADLMAALVQQAIDRHGDGELRIMPPTAEQCTVHYRRWGQTERLSYTYTMADAQRAGLHTRSTWKSHPAAMLKARAVSAVCRMEFPDIISGLYAPEELDGAAAYDPGTPAPGEAKWSDGMFSGDPAIQDEREPDEQVPTHVDQQTGETEDLASVKRDIIDLAGAHEVTRDDLRAIAHGLSLPAWRDLTMAQAHQLREELVRRIDAGQPDDSADDPTVQDALWEPIDGEAGDDRYTAL